MACAFSNPDFLRRELVKAHKSRYGVDCDKAEHEFISLAQTLPHYGGHFYTAVWVKCNKNSIERIKKYIFAGFERWNSKRCLVVY